MTDLEEAAAELELEFGPDPTMVGEGDDEQDEWGDLLVAAARALGVDIDELPDEDWSHFQDVAMACQANRMLPWLEHLRAALRVST